MLNELGIAQDLMDQGLKAPIYQYRDRRTGEIFPFDLSELEGETTYPFRLQCEQFKLARLLSDKLDAHDKAEVHFNHRVVYFEQDADGITVFVETPMEIKQFRADYLIAADGGSSITRKWLGVQFEGFTYPEKFLTLSTPYPIENHFDDLCYVNYVADPQEWQVLLKVPELWRVLVPAPNDMSDEQLLSDETKTDVFERFTGKGSEIETKHRTIYRVHQRVATKYNHGRVCLVGDAAHLNNPLGGFGMNSGIHDGWNLADKLISILSEGAEAEPLLDLFDRQRRAVMHSFIQAQTIANKKAMETTDEDAQKQHKQEMSDILADNDRRRDFLRKQAMIKSLEEEKAVA